MPWALPPGCFSRCWDTAFCSALPSPMLTRPPAPLVPSVVPTAIPCPVDCPSAELDGWSGLDFVQHCHLLKALAKGLAEPGSTPSFPSPSVSALAMSWALCTP